MGKCVHVLVTGASGFIASGVIEALLDRDNRVRACARRPMQVIGSTTLDYARSLHPEDWRSQLDGIDAVVNCCGILRERGRDTFERIHYASPKALAEACFDAGVRKFIQISALGDSQDGSFIATKHRFDEWLLASELAATIIRPSVVVSPRGSYGGTSLLRALAAFPGFVFIPGSGNQVMQPVLLEDLADLVVRCLDTDAADGKVVYAVGPQVITLRDYLLTTRSWLGLPEGIVVKVPRVLDRVAIAIGEHTTSGPLGRTISGMLERGNVAPAGGLQATTDLTDWRPRSVSGALARTPSFVQDRWHARFYLIAPVVLVVLVGTWIGSGITGLVSDPQDARAILDSVGIALALQPALVGATSFLDLMLGIGLVVARFRRLVLWLMLASVVAYTVVLGATAPELWIDPLGGMLKNFGLMVLIGIALIMENRR